MGGGARGEWEFLGNVGGVTFGGLKPPGLVDRLRAWVRPDGTGFVGQERPPRTRVLGLMNAPSLSDFVRAALAGLLRETAYWRGSGLLAVWGLGSSACAADGVAGED